jgi:hypothetical protein
MSASVAMAYERLAGGEDAGSMLRKRIGTP